MIIYRANRIRRSSFVLQHFSSPIYCLPKRFFSFLVHISSFITNRFLLFVCCNPSPYVASSSSLTTVTVVALTCFDACSNGMKTGNGNDSLAGPFSLKPCVPSRACPSLSFFRALFCSALPLSPSRACPSLSLFRLRSRSALACLAPKYLGALKPPAFCVAASVSESLNLQQN